MNQRPEDDKALHRNAETDVEKLKKDELVERLRASEAQNAELNAQNAKLLDKAAKGAALLDDAEAGDLPEYEMELVQFHKNYSYGGQSTANPRIMAHRNFSVNGGEVVYMPKKLAKKLAKDRAYEMNIGRKNLVDQVVASLKHDPDTGRRVPVERTIKVEALVKNAREVGLAVVR